MPGIEDKLMTASQIKEVTDTKLDKDFSSLDTSGGFSLTDELAVNISGSPYRITGRTLANAIGGGGTEQAALTNYVKNCGTISSLPATFTDSNITADMIVIEYTVGDESAVGSDWTVTTSDGSFTIAGTLAKSTSLSIVFGVGYSTTPSILTNLASDSPDNILKASPRPGVTGVLPLVNGGVGSSTAAGARTNLDVYSKSETNSAIQQSTASSYVIWGAQGQSSGNIRLARCGKVRLLSLEDVVVPSDATFAIDRLPEGDRPDFLTVSALYAGNSNASIWVRPAGSFGTTGFSGHTINGQLVWFAV